MPGAIMEDLIGMTAIHHASHAGRRGTVPRSAKLGCAQEAHGRAHEDDANMDRPYAASRLASCGRLGPYMLALCLAGAALAACGGRAEPARNDSLLASEVEEELKSIPRPLDEFRQAINGQQTFFPDYGKELQADATRESDLVTARVQGYSRSPNAQVRLAPGYKPDDVLAFTTLMSWDGYSSGVFGVRVTAWWSLYLGRDDLIIGYAKVSYGDDTDVQHAANAPPSGSRKAGRR